LTRKGNAQLDAPSPVPPWLAKFVGDDFFSYPARLSLGSDQVNEDDIGYIARLTSLRALSLQCRCVSSRGFAPLKNLSRLEFLYLRDGFVDDEALRIVEHMPELRVLSLRYTRVTDRRVPLLAK
jgi:hypothetical protein